MPSHIIDPVSRDAWIQWKANPVTKQAVAGLLNQRSLIFEALCDYQFSTNDEKLQAIGEAKALKDAVMYLIDNFDYSRGDKEDVEGDSVSDSDQT